MGLVAYSSERSHPEFIPAAEEPELYLWFLIASRSDPRAKGVGKTLVEKCEQEARESGVGLLRVDCFDGDVANGALVRVYEGMRFRRLGSRYNVKGWVGQVLGKRLEGVGGSRR